jgi:hypothetical protein
VIESRGCPLVLVVALDAAVAAIHF